ncbi:hypothetical protein B0H66DRAFT_555828 [Apodospora peruviana]|uniref:Uncharacterized protein n=1 Tax=Apodospora peruviana TaxID=516989 RepID=A0AAE0I4C1_9PEZI|nr:hypothetical protein B0H66DRAFT_555828 [Apodospora peruviana]
MISSSFSLSKSTFRMHSHILLLGAILQSLTFCLAVEEQQFYRWKSPRSDQVLAGSHDLYRRQGPLPGYHPEFGTCGSGTTCENACGGNWQSCRASTELSLFCYNKVDLGQTCCENGSGRACDRGYYCAWKEFAGKTWCCKDGQSLEECGFTSSSSVLGSTSSSLSPSFSGSSSVSDGSSSTLPASCPTPSITSCPSMSMFTVTSTETVTVASGSPSGGDNGGRYTTTVTVTTEKPGPSSIVHVSVFSTISVTVTRTDTGATVTVTTIIGGGGGECSSTSSPPPPPPSPTGPTSPTPTHPYVHVTTKVKTITTTTTCSTTPVPYFNVLGPATGSGDAGVVALTRSSGTGHDRVGVGRWQCLAVMVLLRAVLF